MNTSMIKKTFLEKGLPYVSELTLKNVKDLIEVIRWNNKNGIKFYRMSSDMFPWMSEYKLSDLPDYKKISILLNGAGHLAKANNQRLTFHPGPFNVLASPSEGVVVKTISELNKHSEIMDLMGLDTSTYNKINIHVGGVYGDKKSAMERWVSNFHLLDENTKSRLTVENDDKTNCYGVSDLMYIHKNTGVPIVFDYHHHSCHPNGMDQKESLLLALSTWPTDVKPVVHYSESRSKEQMDEKIRPQAHSDYVYDKIEMYGNDFDIMVEAKKKELAVRKYAEIHMVDQYSGLPAVDSYKQPDPRIFI